MGMSLEKKKKYKLLHKKLIRLRVNPLKNSKFLNLVTVIKRPKENVRIERIVEIGKKKRKKWELFLKRLAKANDFFFKYRAYAFHNYKVQKFASQGNSFNKQHRKDLFT